MKIRNLLVAFVLSMMFLCAGNFTVNTVKASPCTNWCVSMYHDCEAQCNGNAACLRACQIDYVECMCGCGVSSNPCP